MVSSVSITVGRNIILCKLPCSANVGDPSHGHIVYVHVCFLYLHLPHISIPRCAWCVWSYNAAYFREHDSQHGSGSLPQWSGEAYIPQLNGAHLPLRRPSDFLAPLRIKIPPLSWKSKAQTKETECQTRTHDKLWNSLNWLSDLVSQIYPFSFFFVIPRKITSVCFSLASPGKLRRTHVSPENSPSQEWEHSKPHERKE